MSHIRPATAADNTACAAIHNALFPAHRRTADQLRHEAAAWDPQFVRTMLVEEQDHALIGYGLFHHMPGMFQPHSFQLGVYVAPALHGRGLGKALYNQLMSALHQHQPHILRSVTLDDQARAVRFLKARGFREERRFWESRLDVPAFDPAPFAQAVAQVQAQGITIKPLSELQADPEWSRKLFGLICEVERSMPTPEPLTHNYERWLATRMNSPNLRPDGYFLALRNGEYVGLSSVWASQADNNLWTGLTGVRPAERRRGIALALKLRAIEYARQQGCPQIVTDNEANNRAMLALNERLGFVCGVAELWLSAKVQEAA